MVSFHAIRNTLFIAAALIGSAASHAQNLYGTSRAM
jgi:hypothetical protein